MLPNAYSGQQCARAIEPRAPGVITAESQRNRRVSMKTDGWALGTGLLARMLKRFEFGSVCFCDTRSSVTIITIISKNRAFRSYRQVGKRPARALGPDWFPRQGRVRNLSSGQLPVASRPSLDIEQKMLPLPRADDLQEGFVLVFLDRRVCDHKALAEDFDQRATIAQQPQRILDIPR
jgi:hypothetical protein